MTILTRKDITRKLSILVEKRLTSRHFYWSPEVDFDKNTDNYRRIDYVGFKPCTPRYVVEPASVELGTFICFEIKSCMADFESGNGLTFYGDENYLVCTKQLAENLRDNQVIPDGINAILVPNAPKTALITKLECNPKGIMRKRPASELLWAIVQSHERDKKWRKQNEVPA